MTRTSLRRERLFLIETNIDDMNPQGFELVYERLFAAGALDVWVETILMKKMRPAFKLCVLLKPAARMKILGIVFRETPTLGVRCFELDRFSLPRKTLRVKTRWGPVRFKKMVFDPGHSPARPEYEDLVRIARRQHLPFHVVLEEVKKALRK